MIDLLIAILIALGVHFNGTTEQEIKESNPTGYQQAENIINTGGYKYTDTGVVIVETTGD